jgi:hypothetical protein
MADEPTAICSATTLAGMAQARAVVDVVGAEERPEQLLQQVVVFVGGLGAAVDRHGAGPCGW